MVNELFSPLKLNTIIVATAGHRSLTRDLEVQIAMATTNKVLKQALHKVGIYNQ